MSLLQVLEEIGVPVLVLTGLSRGLLSFSHPFLQPFHQLVCSLSFFSGPHNLPFHPFKLRLSINLGETLFSQGSWVPKGINKSSQSVWPMWLLTIKIISPGSQSWLPSSPWHRQIHLLGYSLSKCQLGGNAFSSCPPSCSLRSHSPLTFLSPALPACGVTDWAKKPRVVISQAVRFGLKEVCLFQQI